MVRAMRHVTRRALIVDSAAIALAVASRKVFAFAAPQAARLVVPQTTPPPSPPATNATDAAELVKRIRDPEIRAGVEAAITKNLVPAAVEQGYPGQFNISADGGAYGGWATWPGLDSWQMAGAYLRLGGKYTRMVLDYFDFVRASQRKDGDVPFAIFTGDARADGGFLSGLKPDDVFSYKPPIREGLPASSQQTRQWIGLFTHWQPKAEPLSTLGPVCHILTAAELFDATHDKLWLKERLPSIEAAASRLLARRAENGLVGHSGFYLELPPRLGFDGVAQCYVVHAWRELARLLVAVAETNSAYAASAAKWTAEADALEKSFVAAFWRDDHFGEYVHPQRGLVDSHGLSDTNFAAIAFGVADETHTKLLWPRLTGESGFWWGGMPTLTVTKPFSYEEWENHEPVPMQVPEMNDVASMGRVWYLEALACIRMKAHARLIDATRRVCVAAKADGFWRERYQPQRDGTTLPARSAKYCEYPAVLLRVVLGSLDVFANG
jgi:hypothetical protein